MVNYTTHWRAPFLRYLPYLLSLSLPALLAASPHSTREAQTLLVQSQLRFEPDPGGGGFVARGRDYGLALNRSGLELSWRGDREHSGTVRMRLAGANPAAQIEGIDPLATRTNYFLGADSARWRPG